jgi:hypothetical protein
MIENRTGMVRSMPDLVFASRGRVPATSRVKAAMHHDARARKTADAMT